MYTGLNPMYSYMEAPIPPPHQKVCVVAEVNQTRVRRELIYSGKALDLYTGQVNCERWPVDPPLAGMLV